MRSSPIQLLVATVFGGLLLVYSMRFLARLNPSSILVGSKTSILTSIADLKTSTGKMKLLTTVDLLTLDASELQDLMVQGNLTSESLVSQVLHQIEREDRSGANLRAMLSVAPRGLLLKTAAKLDRERRDGTIRGPFHGIPIIVKDAIATHPDLGCPTTVGSHALISSRPARNAAVVEKLLKSGFVVIGKTNLNEFCNWKGFNSINGFSAVGGQTNSAYVIGGLREGEASMGHSSPLGSSTGSAVGVSAGFSPVSLGTETDGSLVQPAARAALFALKPTVGSVSVEGAWTLSTRFDAIGAITKSAKDLAIMTEILLTPEARSLLPSTGYKSFLTGSFKGLKVGFLNPEQWHLPPAFCPPIDSVVQQLNSAYFDAISRIRDCGATVDYPVTLPPLDALHLNGVTAMATVLFYEYHKNVDHYLSSLETSEVRSLDELIKWNKEHAEIEMPFQHANQDRLIKACKDIPNEEEYKEAIAHLHKVSHEQGFDPLFSEGGFDIIAMPMDSKIPSMATASGYPIATMPLGILDHLGRPFGLAIMARAGRENLMFQFMSAFESAFPKRQIPPQLVTSDEN